MIIEDKTKLRKKIYKRKDKEYAMYFTTFSAKFSNTLKKFQELHNVELLTDKGKIVLPKVNLFEYSYYLDKKTGQKIPQFSFVIPKSLAEELEKQGIRTLKIIVEVPDLQTKS